MQVWNGYVLAKFTILDTPKLIYGCFRVISDFRYVLAFAGCHPDADFIPGFTQLYTQPFAIIRLGIKAESAS